MKRFLIPLLLSVAMVAVFSAVCLAAPVAFVVGSFDEPGFEASVLHTASTPGPTVGGTTWYTGGSELGHLNGTLTGEWDMGMMTFNPSSLSVLTLDGLLTGNELHITGGEILAGDPAGGTLEYTLTGPDFDQSGTFHFAPHTFNPFANSFGPDGGNLWGQNFIGAGPDFLENKRDWVALGIDLHLQPEPIPTPEPASMAMLVCGLGAAALARRRRGG